MADTYTFRRTLFGQERTYRIEGDTLVWNDAKEEGELRLTDVKLVRIYDAPGARMASGATIVPGFVRLDLRTDDGRAVHLESRHIVKAATFEDRSATFHPFVDALFAAVAKANPRVRFVEGMPWSLWGFWAVIFGISAVAGVCGALFALTTLITAQWIAALASLAFGLSFGASAISTFAVLRAQRPRESAI
jgi:hypothetical protein